MSCYFQGCDEKATTKEHVPPKCFFPDDEKVQLITVGSCPLHNNAKSHNDTYALAHICMNSSPSNRSREIWLEKIAPQLEHNNRAFAKTLLKGSKTENGRTFYSVDRERLDGFFAAVSCGLIYASRKSSLPSDYVFNQIYHNFIIDDEIDKTIADAILDFYSDPPIAVYEFGNPELRNERIYKAEIFGIPNEWGNISIVHTFYGVFKVTSMLTRPFPRLADGHCCIS